MEQTLSRSTVFPATEALLRDDSAPIEFHMSAARAHSFQQDAGA